MKMFFFVLWLIAFATVLVNLRTIRKQQETIRGQAQRIRDLFVVNEYLRHEVERSKYPWQ